MGDNHNADGLALLRQPFPAHQISKLPKETKAQREERERDMSKGIRCPICGGWHHKNAVHLDYVGHAALTDRLLDCDPAWNWEPVAVGPDGLPVIDRNGGMWIKLTVCGITRLGYGHPDGKQGGNAIKELIGDALRNAAMRFGAALDLWHKGDLHVSDDEPATKAPPPAQASDDEKKAAMSAMAQLNDDEKKAAMSAMSAMAQIKDVAALQEYYRKLKNDMPAVANDPNVIAYGKSRKDVLQSAAIRSAVGDDAIPHMDPDLTATGFAT
jgi:hypothetical protein